ncbi:MAG: triple tyrosine motif-containing protein [Agriterribacter sp.]
MIGTHGGGVNILAPNASYFTRILFNKNDPSNLNSSVAAILEDSYNGFWFGGNAGIKLFRKHNDILSPLTGDPLVKKVSRLITNCFFEDSAKKLWIGAASGLYYCMNDTVIHTSIEMGVNCILNDKKGNLWVGTIQGLARYDQNKNTFRLFATADDVPGNNIIGILEDDKDNLWLSTDNGLVKFNTVTHAVQAFTTADGLADNQFNRYSYFKDSNGEFFFGGLSGITHFYPDSITMNANRSPLVFTDFKIFNNTVQVNGKDDILKKNISFLQGLVLEHRRNVFTIEFALLNFIKSEKNRYAYMLKGYDKGWISTNNPSAAYTNVLPGSYEFLVKAANNDGVWTDPVKLGVKISPPLWKTWWAYAIYTIAVLAVLFFIIQYFFLKEILKKEEALHELKLNFFTRVSHEIRTHLTLIMIPLDKIVSNASANDAIAHQLTSVKTKFYRLLRLVTELMDFQKVDTKNLQLKVSNNDLVLFLKDIFDSFQEISISKNIRATFSHNTTSILLNFDPE